MRLIFLISFLLLSTIADARFNPFDIFRKKEYRNLTKCERQFKRALDRCPDLVDTTQRSDSGAEPLIVHDTIYLTKVVGMTMDAVDSLMNAKIDSLNNVSQPQKESIKKQMQLTPQEKALLMERLRKEIIASLPPPECIKDTLTIPLEGGSAKVWQQGDSLAFAVNYKPVTFKNPCPEEFLPWYVWLLIGFAAGVIIVFWTKK